MFRCAPGMCKSRGTNGTLSVMIRAGILPKRAASDPEIGALLVLARKWPDKAMRVSSLNQLRFEPCNSPSGWRRLWVACNGQTRE
jgi:hypothetical protein